VRGGVVAQEVGQESTDWVSAVGINDKISGMKTIKLKVAVYFKIYEQIHMGNIYHLIFTRD
jgi:hypothetical protein